jgi:hypothetical protein
MLCLQDSIRYDDPSVCATIVRRACRYPDPDCAGPRRVAISPGPRASVGRRGAGPTGSLPNVLASVSRVWEVFAE